jgi:hypothetical protein
MEMYFFKLSRGIIIQVQWLALFDIKLPNNTSPGNGQILRTYSLMRLAQCPPFTPAFDRSHHKPSMGVLISQEDLKKVKNEVNYM